MSILKKVITNKIDYVSEVNDRYEKEYRFRTYFCGVLLHERYFVESCNTIEKGNGKKSIGFTSSDSRCSGKAK